MGSGRACLGSPNCGGCTPKSGDLVGHDATWTPDGERILYARGHELFLAKSDGSESRRLATVPGIPVWPRWSPDGRLLRFTIVDSMTFSKALWQVSSDGSNLRPLLPGWNNPPAECCGNFTRDGKYYVFESYRGRMTAIWAIRENAGIFSKPAPRVQLTAGPLPTYAPVPSRNGRVLFVIGAEPRGELV